MSLGARYNQLIIAERYGMHAAVNITNMVTLALRKLLILILGTIYTEGL